MHKKINFLKQIALLTLVILASGCVSSGRSIPAPVEDKGTPKKITSTKPVQATTPAKAVVQTTEVQSKAGFYTVKQGDTLIKIGLDHGQNWRDIMRWNSIENANLIEVGQVLRITPPAEALAEEVVIKPVTPPGNVSSTSDEPKISDKPANTPSSSANQSNPEAAEETISFSWPVQGNVLAGFDDLKNKGIDIAGKLGEPVLASADGKVVYAGSGLRGYGNLVILKHNNTFLTAYAHNQSLTVKEDQLVKRGQKIAEMGNSDADGVKLHFEIRKMGKPVDPLKLLKQR